MRNLRCSSNATRKSPRRDFPTDRQKDVRGEYYCPIRDTERLAETGIEPSVGIVGDSFGTALTETMVGLFKTEGFRHGGPLRYLAAVQFVASELDDASKHRHPFR